jgi:hypothetical protein
LFEFPDKFSGMPNILDSPKTAIVVGYSAESPATRYLICRPERKTAESDHQRSAGLSESLELIVIPLSRARIYGHFALECFSPSYQLVNIRG